jgi:hypothetical protein
MRFLGIDIHPIEDYFEIREIAVFLAQESGQQVMGEFDRALPSIRDNKDDVDFREQPPEQLHFLKLFPVRNRDNGDRIRFDGHPESFPEAIQSFEEFYSTFRDNLMNGRLKSFVIFINPA